MNLSQDEINAMLSGKAPAEEPSEQPETAEASDRDSMDAVLSDIQAELNSGLADTEESLVSDADVADLARNIALDEEALEARRKQYPITPEEEDTLGEVGNICMGAVATTMYTLLDRRVSITTPRVTVHTTREVLAMYSVPFVVVEVNYVEGIEGKNLLMLKETDAAMITDLLMGGDGQIEEPIELNELHMSAISEIMNQMIGASATALSKVINTPVNISTPVSNRVDLHSDVSAMINDMEMVVMISFDMEIEGLLESQLLQLIPYELGLEMVKKLNEAEAAQSAKQKAATAPAKPPEVPTAAPPPAPAPSPAYDAPPMPPAPAFPQAPAAPVPGNLVDVKPMQYASFDMGHSVAAQPQRGIDLVQDIPLQVSVELGRTKKEISEILDFGTGTVVVLDKMAGEPVEILVNGKLIGRGEVVVIDENYGVRITEIVSN